MVTHISADNNELLGCPFCGGIPTMHCGGPGNWFLQCNGCKCSTNDVQHDHAISLWNTRASITTASGEAATPQALELAKCFDTNELRGYSPIRNFTPQERRMIATALRGVAQARPACKAECDGQMQLAMAEIERLEYSVTSPQRATPAAPGASTLARRLPE